MTLFGLAFRGLNLINHFHDMHLAESEQTELIRVHVNLSIIFLPGLISDAGKPKSPLDPTTESHHVLEAVTFYRLSFSRRTNPFWGPFDDPKNAARGLLLTVERRKRAAQITVMVSPLVLFSHTSVT